MRIYIYNMLYHYITYIEISSQHISIYISFWWSTTMMYTSNKKAVMKQPKACRCDSFSMGWLVYLPSWKPIEINVFPGMVRGILNQTHRIHVWHVWSYVYHAKHLIILTWLGSIIPKKHLEQQTGYFFEHCSPLFPICFFLPIPPKNL